MPDHVGRPPTNAADVWVERTRLAVEFPEPDLTWRSGEGFSTAEPSPALISLVDESLQTRGLERVGGPLLVRHQAGDSGWPDAGSPGPVGFSLDLADGGPTVEGGLLLFVESGTQVSGWRSEVGALTMWSGAEPLVTELTPRAPTRVALYGRARCAQR